MSLKPNRSSPLTMTPLTGRRILTNGVVKRMAMPARRLSEVLGWSFGCCLLLIRCRGGLLICFFGNCGWRVFWFYSWFSS